MTLKDVSIDYSILAVFTMSKDKIIEEMVLVGRNDENTKFDVYVEEANGATHFLRSFGDATEAVALALRHCGWGPLGKYSDDPADNETITPVLP